MDGKRGKWLALGTAALALSGCTLTDRPLLQTLFLPEQRMIDVRDPGQLPPAPLPNNTEPRTVAQPRPETEVWRLSLDDAIRIALENANVVRALVGTTAVTTGRTIYDAAIVNTTIDQQNARFDPRVLNRAVGGTTQSPFALLDPLNPLAAFITDNTVDTFRNEFGLAQTNLLGGETSLNWIENPTRTRNTEGLALNPSNFSALELGYTQPLLQGGGFNVNVAPILIARINTEQSFFQYKSSVQTLVRGVIEAYWNLVQARVTLWARKIQVEQSQEQFEREQARQKVGISNLSNLSQAKVTYGQFKAQLIAAEADVLNREAALRNILGLPPNDQRQIVPTSVPTNRRLPKDWFEIIQMAERFRPDIVELKLVLEADQIRIVQAQNQAQPRLDAFANYRWNGLSGTAPNGDYISERGGFNDWTVGVNFSVPLGLRAERANLRQQELLIARDRVNLDQAIHAAIHDLAGTLRNLDSAYEQFQAFKDVRAAAFDNLNQQNEEFRSGRAIFLNVLLALNDWGNAVTSEAQALLSYNIALAVLEEQTGTILESHGLVFYEERFRAAGPWAPCEPCRDYPESLRPHGEKPLYPPGQAPSEEFFDLKKPDPRIAEPAKPEAAPPPRVPPPAPRP